MAFAENPTESEPGGVPGVRGAHGYAENSNVLEQQHQGSPDPTELQQRGEAQASMPAFPNYSDSPEQYCVLMPDDVPPQCGPEAPASLCGDIELQKQTGVQATVVSVHVETQTDLDSTLVWHIGGRLLAPPSEWGRH